MIEVAGPSIRNRGQRETMHAKMQACLDPEAVQVWGGRGVREDAGGSRTSLFFVAASDLEDARFRKTLSRRIVLECMHAGVWGAVPEHSRAWRLRRAIGEQARNIVAVTYAGRRSDLWGGLDQLAECK